mmetsp:Transcript_691/g.2768  ORF Transcript_691/g.2768 Transcript_691/m.2768 type:complete len:117 (+) Transcript_691:1036-1386(+)
MLGAGCEGSQQRQAAAWRVHRKMRQAMVLAWVHGRLTAEAGTLLRWRFQAARRWSHTHAPFQDSSKPSQSGEERAAEARSGNPTASPRAAAALLGVEQGLQPALEVGRRLSGGCGA